MVGGRWVGGFNKTLNYDGVEFAVQEKDFSKFGTKNNICINMFCYENKLIFPIHISDQKFENWMGLLLVINEKKSILCTSNVLTDLCFTKQRIKTKLTFLRAVHSALVVKMLTEHNKVCLTINGAQSVRFEKRKIEFKNYLKQIPVSFKHLCLF